jgi:Tfp pilus assembly protein PilN
MVSFRKSDSAVLEADASELVAPQLGSASSAAFPRVNLMPEVIAAEARVRRARTVMVGAGVAAVAVVGGLYVLAMNDVNAAQERVDTATAQSIVLKNELAKYSDVPKVQAEVALAEGQLFQAMGGEVRWSFLLNDLSLKMPAGTSLTNFAGTINGVAPDPAAASAAAASGQPSETAVVGALGNVGIGTITYKGEAFGYTNVAAFLDAIAKQKPYIDTYPGTVAKVQADNGVNKGYEFEASTTVTDKALSHRYDPKAGS